MADQLQTYDLIKVFGIFPIVGDVDYFTLFNEPSVNGRIELFGLIGGGNQKAVTTAVDDFVQDDV